jgi:hypothetical protein
MKRSFDPWGRGFIDWDRGSASEPLGTGDRYSVSFYLEDRRIFILEYAPDSGGGAGYIYLPGPGHPDFSLNAGTIIGSSTDRWDPNGKWQHATAKWDEAMRKVLATNEIQNIGTEKEGVADSKDSGVASSDVELWAGGVALFVLLSSLTWFALHGREIRSHRRV